MADIKVEIYCMSCGHKEVFEDHKRPFECPKCGSPLLHETCIIECEDCGKDVYLTDNTNECECGALYNGFGERLSDPEEWDEEDRYGTFGPEDYMD